MAQISTRVGRGPGAERYETLNADWDFDMRSLAVLPLKENKGCLKGVLDTVLRVVYVWGVGGALTRPTTQMPRSRKQVRRCPLKQ